MHKLDIDFQSTTGKAPSAGMALLALAVLLGLALLLLQNNISNQLAAMDAAQGRIASGGKEGTASQKKSESDQSAQAAFNQLTLPWSDVFAALEAAADKQVILLALEGDGRNRVIKVVAQAPHADAMFAYLDRLKSNGKLGGWRLLSHRKGDDGVLHFEIQAVLPEDA